MFNNKSVVAIVPARGGSKGIYKKNITLLNGKPLIEYTLDVALKSSYIDEVIVSTDDLEIEMISKNIGAKIVKRPPAISTDSSLTLDTIKHVIKQVGFINDETIIILLQATSPLREQHHIKDSLEFFTNSCTSVVSVCESEHTPYKMYKIHNNKLVDFISEKWRGIPRQRVPKVYRENGSIYVTSAKNVMNNSLYGNNPRPYVMKSSFSIDIDTKFDLKLAELALEIKITDV
ncbi:acylneuraminate cytidylyltransferase family protein [bacterium]|jgi:CMP-N,N'-diacetyllegionaminic acid synthase|nr:acylneuraminate cytidylyltransferase family protein [bacterium]